MFSAPYKNWWRQSWHPAEQDLFLCLEGELGTKPAARIRKHLERCWPCRMKHEELKHSISSIMKCRSALLASAPGFPAHAEQRFLAKLGRQAAAEEKKDTQLTLRLKALLGKTTPRRLPLAFACGVAVFLGILLWLRLGSVPIVSAREMLEQTKRAEDQRVARMANPVVYQKLRVRRTSTSPEREHVLVWETWSDPRNRRFRQEVEEVSSQGSRPARPEAQASPSDRLAGPAVLDDLTQVFRTNHMDPRRPLSAAGFESWRRSIHPASEEVREATLADGSRALILTTTVTEALRENAIANAELVVRAADWHPIQQRLKVQGKQELWEYELTETAFDVVALNSLDASFFAVVTPTAVKLPLPALSKTLPFVPAETEWIATEIEAYYALHGAKACLGEQLEVVRTASGQVQVKGLVETPERKQELLLALQALPQVSSSIQTVADALIASASQGPAAGGSGSAPVPSEPPSREEVRSQRLPFQDQLERHFSQLDQTVQPSGRKAPGGVARRIAELSDQSISISRSLLLEAWALRRLAEKYPQESIRELRPRARWLLETMLREHLEGQRAPAAQLRSLLLPVLNAIAGEPAVSSLEGTDLLTLPGPEDLSWRAMSLLLFGRCERVVDLTRDLFAGQGLSDAAADEAVRDLLSMFRGWEAVSDRLESEISRAFPGNPNRASAKQ